MFDSGSQRSYISEKVRSRLKLQTTRTEKVVIKTFGQSGNSEVQKLDVVQFKVRNKNDPRFTFVEALCVHTLCSPLTNRPLDSVRELPEFKKLEFADFEHDHQSLPVGILIGIDYYHIFMTGKVVYNKHTCREVSPGLDAPRVAYRAKRGEFGKLPATRGASNPGLTSLQVCLL